MANFATVLKEEIKRLARKEAKAVTDTARRQSAQHRRDIATLKRQVSGLQKKVALLEKKVWKQGVGAGTGSADEQVRFSAKGLKSQRDRLGISAADYAALVGVSTQTLYNWEHGRSRPQRAQIQKLAAIRGLGKREALARLEHLG